MLHGNERRDERARPKGGSEAEPFRAPLREDLMGDARGPAGAYPLRWLDKTVATARFVACKPPVTHATCFSHRPSGNPVGAGKFWTEDVENSHFGAVTGRDDVKREGKAQQDKGDAQRDAAKKEAQAESARGAARASEEREKANQ